MGQIRKRWFKSGKYTRGSKIATNSKTNSARYKSSGHKILNLPKTNQDKFFEFYFNFKYFMYAL